MDDQDGEIHVNEAEASGGEKTGVMRWVLGIGMLLAIVLLSAIWMTGAATQGDSEGEISVSGEATPDNTDGTDSIVSDGMDEIDAADPDSDVDTSAATIEN